MRYDKELKNTSQAYKRGKQHENFLFVKTQN